MATNKPEAMEVESAHASPPPPGPSPILLGLSGIGVLAFGFVCGALVFNMMGPNLARAGDHEGAAPADKEMREMLRKIVAQTARIGDIKNSVALDAQNKSLTPVKTVGEMKAEITDSGMETRNDIHNGIKAMGAKTEAGHTVNPGDHAKHIDHGKEVAQAAQAKADAAKAATDAAAAGGSNTPLVDGSDEAAPTDPTAKKNEQANAEEAAKVGKAKEAAAESGTPKTDADAAKIIAEGKEAAAAAAAATAKSRRLRGA